MPRKYNRLNGRNLTIECPTCRAFSFIHRLQWKGNKSSELLGCLKCGASAKPREWLLVSVPWMRVAS